MGRRRRRRNRGRSRTSRLLDPAGIFSKRKSRKSTSQATKAAVVAKKGDAQQVQAANVAAQQVQNQQAIGTMGPQIGGAASAAQSGIKNAMAGGQVSKSPRPGGGSRKPGLALARGAGGGRDGGLGRSLFGRALDRGTGGRDFGGGYRNRAFGMGRGERGYGMGRGRGGMAPDFMGNRGGGGQDPNMIMNMGGGERGYGMGRGGRGFGMGRGGRDVMQSGMGGYGRQPQGRPNPYANVDAGGWGGHGIKRMAQGRQNIWDQGLAQTGRRGGGGGGSSYNPGTGRMEYASTPRNFSQRSQRGGKGGGFRGRRSNAFPAMAAMSMFSDIRMKENIERTGTSQSGIPIYEFNYIDDNNRYNGAIAQDLLAMGKKDAVHKDKETGYYKIDYSQIDVSLTLKN